MLARAKRRGLRLSFRATARCPPGASGVFELRFDDGAVKCLMLARLQRVGNGSGGERHAPAARSRQTMCRFKSARHLQRFASVHDQVANPFTHCRYHTDA